MCIFMDTLFPDKEPRENVDYWKLLEWELYRSIWVTPWQNVIARKEMTARGNCSIFTCRGDTKFRGIHCYRSKRAAMNSSVYNDPDRIVTLWRVRGKNIVGFNKDTIAFESVIFERDPREWLPSMSEVHKLALATALV